jgi:hypothetical protein
MRRDSLSRVQFSAFGAAAVLLAVMMMVNRGRTPAAASAAEMPVSGNAQSAVAPATQPAVVSDASR